MKKPSITILYHFFHPDNVVSARQFSDLARELAYRGWDVTVLTSNRYWQHSEAKIPIADEIWNGVHIIRVPRLGWNQANDILRIGNSLQMMTGWILKLLQLPPTDVVLVGSDPQFSQLIFPAIKKLIRPKLLVHWCFDLFPDAILASGTRGPVRWLAKLTQQAVKRTYQSVDLMVDIGPCMRRRLNQYNHNARCETLTPWALLEPRAPERPDPAARQALFGDASLALLYSGNMGKAHDFVPFLHLARVLRRIDPRIMFCFACRGNRLTELKEAITPQDENVRIADFADESELRKRLNAADIHLLSLRPEWTGVVVPSKFFGSLAVGKPVIYAGPEFSSIAGWIREFDVGLVMTQDNFRTVIEELLRISRSPDVLASWQRNAMQTYQDNFSKRIVMDAWNSVLRTELQGNMHEWSRNLSVVGERQPARSSRTVENVRR